MLNEPQKKPQPRRQYNTHKKRQDETNDGQIEIEKGKEGKKNKTNEQQECKRKKTAHKGNTHTSDSQAARGGCSTETK